LQKEDEVRRSEQAVRGVAIHIGEEEKSSFPKKSHRPEKETTTTYAEEIGLRSMSMPREGRLVFP